MNKYFFLFRKKERLFFLVRSIVRSILQSSNRLFNRLFVQSIIQVYKQFFLLFFLLLLSQLKKFVRIIAIAFIIGEINTIQFFFPLSSFLSLLSLVSCLLYRSRLGLKQNNNKATNNILFSFIRIFFSFCFRYFNFPTSFPRRLRLRLRLSSSLSSSVLSASLFPPPN